MALLMAHAFGSELDLVFVVPTLGTLPSDRSATATLLPATTRALLDLDQQQAADYLQRVSDQCRTAGLAANAHVLRGDTVTELVQYAERVGCDLIAMPSHGRVGLKALLAGSVTRRISAKVKTPLLLVRDTGE
jgi:nucleotide-binding universal stress UspA family protein